MWLHVPSTYCPSVPAPEGLNSDSTPPNPEPELFATSSGKVTPRPLSWRGWKTRPWIKRLCGTTLPPSTLQHGVDAWISSLLETPASPTASPEAEKARPTIAGCSIISSESSMTAGLLLSSEKTCRGMRTDNSPLSSLHWSDWASALRQEYSARRKSAPATEGSGCSSWPTADAGIRGGYNTSPGPAGSRPTLVTASKDWATPQAHDIAQGNPNRVGRYGTKHGGRNLTDDVQTWGTPRVGMERLTDASYDRGRGNLEEQAGAWPTPRAGEGDKWSAGKQKKDSLQQVSRQWPTPGANDHKGTAKEGQRRGQLDEAAEQKYRFSPPDPQTSDGPPSSKARRTLNPLFVELLQGWPIGWTDCDSAVTGLSLYRRRMRTELSRLCSRTPEQASMF